jgi:cobalt-zinc-cadmium efflux system outer membrane protein
MRWLHAAVVAAALGVCGREAQADDAPTVVPSAPDVPKALTLDEALRIFHSKGLDLLIADAQVSSAEGDVHISRAVANPNFMVAAGPAFNYNGHDTPACPGCQQYELQWGVSDNGALMDAISGKRGLRIDVARAALKAARLQRVDAERVLGAAVKQAYVTVVLSKEALDFSVEVQAKMSETLRLSRLRYPSVITEGDLARIEVQKLEADQAVDNARAGLRQAQVALALLLGVRGPVPDFDIDAVPFKFVVPASLQATSEQELYARAIESRPDLKEALAQMERSELSVSLAERQRFPDISLFANYTQLGMGQNVGQPMNLIFGVSMNLPVFYQQKGEITKAKADRDAQALGRAKAMSVIASDVTNAYSAFVASRDLVQRMEGGLLDRAETAEKIIGIQYRNGSVAMMDFLDAERTYIATKVEYFQDLDAYWTAVYQLEQAVGTELK